MSRYRNSILDVIFKSEILSGDVNASDINKILIGKKVMAVANSNGHNYPINKPFVYSIASIPRSTPRYSTSDWEKREHSPFWDWTARDVKLGFEGNNIRFTDLVFVEELDVDSVTYKSIIEPVVTSNNLNDGVPPNSM